MKKRETFDFTFYGFIRKYKGLDYLLEAFSKIKNDKIRLNILGEVWHKDRKYWENKINYLNIKNKVNFVPNFIEEKNLLKYMASSDCFVLPYEKVSSSGVFSLAVNFKKPFIMTNTGIFADIQKKYKIGYVFENKNVNSLLSIMLKVINNSNNNKNNIYDEYIKNNKFENYSESLLNTLRNTEY